MSKKTQEQIEFDAGLVLGMLQNKGYGPLDTVTLLVTLSAYMIERERKPASSLEAATENFCDTLKDYIRTGVS